MNYVKLKKILLESDLSNLNSIDIIDLKYGVLTNPGEFINKRLSGSNELIQLYNEMTPEKFGELIKLLDAKVEFDVYSKLDDYRKLLILDKDHNLITYIYNKFREKIDFDSSFYNDIKIENSRHYCRYIENKKQFFLDIYNKNNNLFVAFLCKENILEYCTPKMIDDVFKNIESYDKNIILNLSYLANENTEYLNLLIKYNKLEYLILLANETEERIDSKYLDNVDLEKFVCSYRNLKINYLNNEKYRKFIISKKEFYECKYSRTIVINILEKLNTEEKRIFINNLTDTYEEFDFDIIDDLKEFLNQNDIDKLKNKFKEQFQDINKAVEIIEKNRYKESELLIELLNKVETNKYNEIMEKIKYNLPKYCIDKMPLEKLVVPYNESYRYNYFEEENEELLRLAVKQELFYKDIDKNSISKFKDTPSDITKTFIENCYKYTDLIEQKIKEGLVLDDTKLIINNLSDDKIITIVENLENNFYFFRILEMIPDNLKNKLYFEGYLEKKLDLNNFMTIDDLTGISTKEIFEDLKTKTNFRYTSLPEKYLQTKKQYLLIEIMKNADKVGYIGESGAFPFSLTEEEYNIVPEEYKIIYKESFKKYPAQNFLELYFNKYSERNTLAHELRNYYHEIFKQKIKTIDEFNFRISPNYLYFISDRDFEELLKKMPKEDLLLLALKYEKFSIRLKEEIKNNPDYLKDVKITKIDKYRLDEKYISDTIVENNKYLLNILNNEQLIVFAQNKYLEDNDEILEIIKNTIINNPNYMQPNIVKYFKDEELNYIFSNMEIIELMKNLILYKKNYSNLESIISKRIEEIIYYINNEDDFKENMSVPEIINLNNNNKMIINLLTEEKLNDFIESITNFDYMSILLSNINHKNIDIITKLENRFIKLINTSDIDFQHSMYYLPFDEERKKQFLDKINDDKIFNYLLSIVKFQDKKNSNSKYVGGFLSKKIKEKKDLIINPDIYILLDELYLYLDEEDKTTINNIIDNEFKKYENKFEDKYFETLGSKCCYIGIQKNNLMNEKTMSILKELLNHNIHLFQSLDYRILDKDILKLGGYFIEKLTRYPELCSKIVLIKNKKPENFELFIKLINNMNENTNKIIMDTKFVIILDYLTNNDEIKNNNYILEDIENYILNNHYNKTIKNININNFNNNLEEYIKNKINSGNIKQIKNAIYIKYFGIEENIINNFTFSYLQEFQNIKEYCEDQYILEYINNILILKNVDDIEILKKYNTKKYTINDYLIIREMLKEYYVDSIKDDIKKYNKGTTITIEIDNKKIECIDLTENYGLFIHSTDAYGSMPLLNNNYYDSWNYSTNTRNHGICTCFITNTSYGIPDVKENGVLFGFENINNNDIPLMAPYDLVTRNSGYTIRSIHIPRFSRLQSISDNTRHTHNETSLERRIINNKGFTELRQPDCVIIFEDFPERIKQNSIKAYEDFKNSGHPIKLIYINREKNMNNQLNILDKEIEEYEKKYDLNLLKEIINRHNSNRSSTNNVNVKVDKSFRLEKIIEILEKTLDNIEENSDYDYLLKFEEVLEKEDYKYNMIKEIFTNRQRIFNAYNSEIRTRIENLKRKINKKII
jgi:hypothetical protein